MHSTRHSESGGDVGPAPAAVLHLALPQHRVPDQRVTKTKLKRAEVDLAVSNELRFQEYWRANRRVLRPRTGLSAQERLANLRARVLSHTS